MLCLGIFVFAHLWGLAYMVVIPAGDLVPMWTVHVASFIAVLAMAAYLWKTEPELRRTIGQDLEDDGGQ